MIEFSIWYIFLTSSYFLILFLFLGFSNKKEKCNNIVGFAALFFVFIHLLLILFLIFQDLNSHLDLMPLWNLTLGLPILIFGLVALVSSLLGYLYKVLFKSRNLNSFIIKMEQKVKERSKSKNDLYRKIPHVLIFIGIFILWLIGVYIIYLTTGSNEGMIPYENNMLYLYLQLITTPNVIRNVLFALGWFYYLLFFFFYGFAILMLINEFTRKSQYFSFPFNILCTIFLNKEEKQGYGTYLYFGIGHMFAAFLCPPMVFFSILGISSIADLVASQIGIRYGRTIIKFNKNKTWEGTIAGSIATFFISFLFLGLKWASMFTLVFIFIDILTNRPINVSDNLLNPIVLSIIYFFIRFTFNLNYYTIII